MISDVVAMSLAQVRWKTFRGLPHFRIWSLGDLARKVDFGFRWVRSDRKKEEFVPRPAQPRIALYKLHGSTNWLRCPLCENLYITPNAPTTWSKGGKGSWWNQCHCSDTRLEAQIVSPSFVREMREPNLVAVWKSTLEFLREADHWVIIGYSFPDEDVGIRALFTRALGSKRELPKIGVVQLDEAARVNYESFFPDGSVRYITGGLPLLLNRWNETRRC